LILTAPTSISCAILRLPPTSYQLAAIHSLTGGLCIYAMTYMLPCMCHHYVCRSKLLSTLFATPEVCHGPRNTTRSPMQIFLPGFRPCLDSRLSHLDDLFTIL
jgi:hypothetical protein